MMIKMTKYGFPVRIVEEIKKGNKLYYVIEFPCGTKKDIQKYNFNIGKFSPPTLSKGTNATNKLKTIYKRYDGIVQRCSNPNATSYDNYGKLGIICEFSSIWEFYYTLTQLNNFKELIENPDIYEIDRINTKDNYSKDNIRIVSISENQRNRKDNYLYDIIDSNTNEIKFTGIITDINSYIRNNLGVKTQAIDQFKKGKTGIGKRNGYNYRVERHQE